MVLILGGVLGAIGGGLLGAAGSALGGFGARRRARRARRFFARAATTAAGERRLFESELEPVRRFYESYFTTPVPSWLSEEYTTRLRSAQEARGMAYGGAPAVGEAGLLAAMAQQGRMAAAPALFSLLQAPLAYEAQAYALRAGHAQAMAGTEGPSGLEMISGALSSGIQGAFGGALAGSSLFGGGPAAEPPRPEGTPLRTALGQVAAQAYPALSALGTVAGALAASPYASVLFPASRLTQLVGRMR